MFLSKNKKNEYPCKPQFYYIISRTWLHDDFSHDILFQSDFSVITSNTVLVFNDNSQLCFISFVLNNADKFKACLLETM